MRALILFLVGLHAGGKYLPLVTKAFDLYDEYEKVTLSPGGTTIAATPDLVTEAKRQWPDLAGQSRDGGG